MICMASLEDKYLVDWWLKIINDVSISFKMEISVAPTENCMFCTWTGNNIPFDQCPFWETFSFFYVIYQFLAICSLHAKWHQKGENLSVETCKCGILVPRKKKKEYCQLTCTTALLHDVSYMEYVAFVWICVCKH
jgi:hypothetical protein